MKEIFYMRGDMLGKYDGSYFGRSAGVYKDLAETVGVENAYKIYSHFKGLQLMFPLKFYSKTYIMQQICSEYNGKNVHALARKYGYSESRVRQILREAKDEIV